MGRGGRSTGCAVAALIEAAARDGLRDRYGRNSAGSFTRDRALLVPETARRFETQPENLSDLLTGRGGLRTWLIISAVPGRPQNSVGWLRPRLLSSA